MECQPSRFVEIAEKSRAKRAQLHEQTAAREAKKNKEDAEVDAVRSLKFAYELKKLKENAASLEPPPSVSDVQLSKSEFEEIDSNAVDESDFDLEQFDFAAETRT